MMTIKIYDKEDGFLTMDLADILRIVGPAVVNSLYWRITDLECHPPRLGGALAAHHHRTSGMPIDILGVELLTFAGEVTQTEMGLFLARSTPWQQEHSQSRVADVARWTSSAEMVIEAFDATYWKVSTSRTEVLENLRKEFKQTEVVLGVL